MINPQLLHNLTGYVLLTVTALALSFQLAAFTKTIAKTRSRNSLAAGIVIILFGTLLFYVAFSGIWKVDARNLPLEESVKKMKEYMENTPGNVSEGTIKEDQNFSGAIVKSGVFQNLNYMSSGSASISEKDGKMFVVLGDDFYTPNGPDLVVYLTKNSGPTMRTDIGAGIELQELKSTRGMQVYEIPTPIDIEEYNSVTIHCRAFNVPWSYAKLE
jgi:hypothetical protein